MPRTLTALGETWLQDLPPQYRDDPDIKAVIDVQSREMARFWAKMDQITDGYFPARDVNGYYLAIWELLLHLSVNPAGYTPEQRSIRDVAFMQKLRNMVSGIAFEQTGATIVGPGFTYQEHIPGDVTTPPENTIRIKLSYDPADPRGADVYNLMREVLPAHIGIQIQYSVGFVVGVSQVGINAL